MSSATFAAEPRRVPLAAMLVLATITFTAITTGFMPSGLLPQISEGLNISEPVTGYLAAAYAGVILVTVIPAARLLTRIPRKTLLISLVSPSRSVTSSSASHPTSQRPWARRPSFSWPTSASS